MLWWELLSNAIAAFTFVRRSVSSPEVVALNKYRNTHGLPGGSPRQSAPIRALHVICPGVREAELPLTMPDWFGLYGPIVLDTTPIEDSDPELNRWLDEGETVVMSMGTDALQILRIPSQGHHR
jgi:hypothetical protein